MFGYLVTTFLWPDVFLNLGGNMTAVSSLCTFLMCWVLLIERTDTYFVSFLLLVKQLLF